MSDLHGQRQVGRADGNLFLDLFVLNQRIGTLIEIALAPTGVRPVEYAVYSQLGIGPMAPTLLCERLGVSRSTMTGHLAALRRRGDTAREPDPADRRSHRVALTESGRRRLTECRPRFLDALRRLEASLDVDADEGRRLLALVDRAAEQALRDLDDSQQPSRTRLARRPTA